MSDPQPVLEDADISLVTSEFEGFGLTILESMASRIPVVGYAAPYGPQALIQHGKNGLLVKDGDQEQLAGEMLRILTNESLWKKCVEGAKKTAKKNSEKQWRKNWLDLHKKMS